MDERVASAAGLFIAVLVVLAVMNKHVFEEIIDDIRGVSGAGRTAAPIEPEVWSGGGELLSVGGGGGGGGEGGGLSGGGGPSADEEVTGALLSPGAEWSAGDRPSLESREEGSDEDAARALSGEPDAGVDADIGEAAGAAPGREPAEDGPATLPRIPPALAPALLMLRCDEGGVPTLWVAGLTPQPWSHRADESLPAALRVALGAHPLRPQRLAVVWQGCSSEQLESTRRLLSELCSTSLAGLSLVDLATERQLPSCGL